MEIWDVSLSPHELSPAGLTFQIKFCVFEVWLILKTCVSRDHPVLYPTKFITESYTNIYFGENQLSPGSFGMLPLTTGYLRPLLRSRVRASPRLSAGLTLPMVSSPGFGSV